MIDWIIIGAGLYGATFARVMTDAGYKCLIVEKREHIGGNCADYVQDGITISRHGGHIFHTDNVDIWRFVNRFAEFWPYRHRIKVNHCGRIYSFPVNLMTLSQIYGGINTPAAARAWVDALPQPLGDNLEAWAVGQIGREAYERLVEGYTMKQWGRLPRDLPASIIKRIPIRFDFNDDYFSDRYQGMPVNGYSAMIATMLDGIEVQTGVDYLADRAAVDGLGENVLYTGAVDALFDYDNGALDYRGLEWETETAAGDYQGAATINYTALEIPYTRVIEWKHFMQRPPASHTIISREFPVKWQQGMEAYYPINDAKNNTLAAVYQARAMADGLYIGGRLGVYRYYDMHQAIGAAMAKAKRWINDN